MSKTLRILLGAILLGLGLAILLRLRPRHDDLTSSPDPARDYNDALIRFRRLQRAEEGRITSSGLSRLLSHGYKTPRAYVLVHGVTNSPLQWAEMGQILHAAGHNVLLLRLPYHGLPSHHVRELALLAPTDLRAYSDEAADIAAGLGDEIVAGGISGGGVVAAWMAQNRAEIDGALLLAPFFGIRGLPDVLSSLVMHLFSGLPNIVLDRPGEPPRAWVYRGQASRGVAAFLALAAEVRRQARAGAAPGGPVAVLTTAVDNTANNRSTATLLDRWRRNGAAVRTVTFAADLDIPHNAIDPAADPAKKRLVYGRMLRLLDETAALAAAGM